MAVLCKVAAGQEYDDRTDDAEGRGREDDLLNKARTLLQ